MKKYRLHLITGFSAALLSACVPPQNLPTAPVENSSIEQPQNNQNSQVQVGVVQSGEPLEVSDYTQESSQGSIDDASTDPMSQENTSNVDNDFEPNIPESSTNNNSSSSNSGVRDELGERQQENQALASLLDKAVAAVGAGNLDQAASSLEQALRIQPNNANTWHDLAQVRMRQEQYQQAVSMAQRSNTYAGSNNSLKARNWTLIAQALQAQGDTAGAQEAQARAAAL